MLATVTSASLSGLPVRRSPPARRRGDGELKIFFHIAGLSGGGDWSDYCPTRPMRNPFTQLGSSGFVSALMIAGLMINVYWDQSIKMRKHDQALKSLRSQLLITNQNISSHQNLIQKLLLELKYVNQSITFLKSGSSLQSAGHMLDGFCGSKRLGHINLLQNNDLVISNSIVSLCSVY